MGRDNAHVAYEIGSAVVLRDLYPDGRIRAVECGRVVVDDAQGTIGLGFGCLRAGTPAAGVSWALVDVHADAGPGK